mmetsp:Transcript_28445/g.67314  ORF Transcript_28445/g.67314 Transcript_28445/m.67314 type:complete len:508 (+) Transcript_28445:435-1958(+)
MALLLELLDVLRGRTTSTRLKHSAAGKEGHDGEHLGGGAEFEDREEIGEVVTENVAGDADGVLTSAAALDGGGHGLLRGEDGDVEPVGVVVLEVGVHLGDELGVVSAVLVEPEDGSGPAEAGALDGELDPVLDGLVLGLAHAPDVALFHAVLEHSLAGLVGHADGAVRGSLERLVVGAVLLGLLGHETNVGDVAHRGHIELTVLLDVAGHLIVDASVVAVGDHTHDILEGIVLVPHHTGVAHDDGHGGIDDDVGGHVEVGDTLRRVDHGKAGAGGVRSCEILLNFLLLRMTLDLLVDVAEAVVGVDLELGEGGGVLGEGVLEEHRDTVAEHDGVRDLHHGALEVKRHHQVLGLGVVERLFEKVAQLLDVHRRPIDDLAGKKGSGRLERLGLTRLGDEFDLHIVSGGHGGALLAAVEVAVGHRGYAGLGLLRPGHEFVRVLLGVFLDGGSDTAVAVALTEHRVDGRAENLGIGVVDFLFLLVGGVLGVVGEVVTLPLKLRDRLVELRD